MPKKFLDVLRLADFKLQPAKLKPDGSRSTVPAAAIHLVHEGRKVERFLEFLAGVGSHLVAVQVWLEADPGEIDRDAPTWRGFGRLGGLSMKQPTRDQDHPLATVPLEVPSEEVAPLLELAGAWLHLVKLNDLAAVVSLELVQPSLLEEAIAATTPEADAGA